MATRTHDRLHHGRQWLPALLAIRNRGQRTDVSGDDYLVVALLHIDVVPALPGSVDDVGDHGLAILADGETPAAERFRSPRLELSVNSHSTNILNAAIPCVTGRRVLGTRHAATPVRTIRHWRRPPLG